MEQMLSTAYLALQLHTGSRAAVTKEKAWPIMRHWGSLNPKWRLNRERSAMTGNWTGSASEPIESMTEARPPQAMPWPLLNRVSPLHTNLQVAGFQRCGRAFHQHQAWVKFQLALHLLLLTILKLYRRPPPLPPLVSDSSCLFTWSQPLYASCCTVLLYFSRYCTVRLKMFSLVFVFVCFLCIICVKSIINLLQCSTI